jgi:uncharacterized protein YciI
MNDQPAAGHPMTANMLGKKVWVVITRAVKSREEVMKVLPQHLQHQVRMEKSGAMFAAGPLKPAGTDAAPGMLGMFVLRAESEAEARRLADADPMHASGARTYDLYQWTMNEGRINISIDLSDRSFQFA